MTVGASMRCVLMAMQMALTRRSMTCLPNSILSDYEEKEEKEEN